MARVLIAGCGYVGASLGESLAAQGDVVWGLRRRRVDVVDPIRPVCADLSEPASLCELPADVDYVVYAVSADAFTQEAYRRAYVDGLVNLQSVLEGRGARGPSRLLYVSSTGVYGQTDGESVDEDSAARPLGFSGRLLLEGERCALGSSIPTVVVRLGGIYGPGRTRLIERVRDQAGCVAGFRRYTNRIHRDDCVGVLAHLMRLESPRSLYVAVDDQPATELEVMRWLALRLGAPPPVEELEEDSSTRTNKRCSNHRLRDSGYRFRYPTYQTGYEAVLRAVSAP